MYSSTLNLTSALDVVGGQRHSPVVFLRGETRYPLYKGAWWAPGPVWTVAENLAYTGILSPDCRARSESLYRLRYPNPHPCIILKQNVT